MKIALKFLTFFLFGIFTVSNPAFGQIPETVGKTEASEPDEEGPVDDIVEKRIINERRVLPYQPLREADIFWEKRIWRVIDIREKMNLPFAYPEMPFFVGPLPIRFLNLIGTDPLRNSSPPWATLDLSVL